MRRYAHVLLGSLFVLVSSSAALALTCWPGEGEVLTLILETVTVDGLPLEESIPGVPEPGAEASLESDPYQEELTLLGAIPDVPWASIPLLCDATTEAM